MSAALHAQIGFQIPASELPEAATEVNCLIACVSLRAQRRLAWVTSLDGQPFDADSPEAEAAWQRDSDTGHAYTDAVAEADGALKGLPQGRFLRISETFALETDERDLLLGTLAPRLEPSILTLYHELQGRQWPTEPLIARLFGHGRRVIWRPDGPLARWRLVTPGDAAPGEPPPLAADPALPFWLQRDTSFADESLVGYLRPIPVVPALPDWPVEETVARLRELLASGFPARLVVAGIPGNGRKSFAAAVSACLHRRPLAVTDIPASPDWATVWTLIQRDARVAGTMPVWCAPTPTWPQTVAPASVQAVCSEPGSALPDDPRCADVYVSLPDLETETALEVLPRLVPRSAAWTLVQRQRIARRPGLTLADLSRLGRGPAKTADAVERALRAAASDRLGDLAERLETPFTWEDLILPAGLLEALRDFAFEAESRGPFWEKPEVRRLFPGGRGLVALFAGSPGTGKTMAAQIIAREIGVDVFRIDLAQVMSKYIGETAKNLRRIFARAAEMHALLLFDEADALFARRTELKDSHDRYANTDTNYLLQQLESFAGIAILATNRKTNIDTAFLRRVRYVFDFPRPDASDRRRLWHRLAPPILGQDPATSLSPVLDVLGDTLELSGAQIKNALVAGHFAACRRGVRPAAADLVKGIDRELAKEGRALSPRDQQRLMRHG